MTLVYKLKKEPSGIFFGYENEDERFITIADFDSIKKLKATILSTDGTKKEESFVLFTIKGESRMISSRNQVEIKNALKDAKVSHCRKPIEIGVINSFISQIERMPTKEINLVETFGYYNQRYIDSRKYTLITAQDRREGFGFSQIYGLVKPTKEYEDFINMEYDMEIVNKVIKVLNEDFPRDDEKEDLKKIMCWNISSVLKFELKQQGVNLFPIFEAVGKKNTGKSTRLRILISGMFNNVELSNESLKGTSGSRLISLDKNTFPIFVDEVKEINEVDSWKNGCSRGYVEFPKGQRDGGHIKNRFYKSLAITTNNFTVLDDALEDRISTIDYNKYLNSNNIPEKTIEFLTNNIVHLGRYIYEKLNDYNYKDLVKEICENYPDYTARNFDKIIFYKVSEKILNDIGLYSDVELSVTTILSNHASQNINLNTTIREVIRKVINDFSYRDVNGKNYTIRRILEEGESTKNVYRELEKKGIFFKFRFKGIIVGANILTTVNNELRLRKVGYQYRTINELAEVLEITDSSQYNPNTPHHIIKWYVVTERVDSDTEETEETNVEIDEEKGTQRGIYLFTKEELLEDDTIRYTNDTL